MNTPRFQGSLRGISSRLMGWQGPEQKCKRDGRQGCSQTSQLESATLGTHPTNKQSTQVSQTHTCSPEHGDQGGRAGQDACGGECAQGQEPPTSWEEPSPLPHRGDGPSPVWREGSTC